jgi:hypothetical protein
MLTAELKRRCKEVTGFDFVDVRWHDTENCLAIFERHRQQPMDAPGVVRHFLVDDNNLPRQLHRGDVEEVVGAIYGRREKADNWRKRWIARQEEAKQQAKDARHELSMETAQEMVRIYHQGTKPFVIHGASDEALRRSVPSDGLDSGLDYVITDLRDRRD